MFLLKTPAIQYFFVLLIFQTTLFSNFSLINQELNHKIIQLSKTKEWHKHLHFKNGESEIDDINFFFSKEGKSNPQSELKASIEKLLSDKSDDENSTLCRYPSRSTWIIENIPELKKHIFRPKCEELQKELKNLDAQYVTLILASAHINSPASAFGHTFLRIDSNPDTPLLSYAINYAAQTAETNGLIYAYQGIFGGYEGRYSISPYYKKIKEYSSLEQRDIWEYSLNLNKEEIERLVLHIFELRHFYANYYFLGENCSYNLLWLLEVAKPELELTSQFSYKAIPIDTVRAIVKKNLVKKTIFRPSERKKILQQSKSIEKNDKALNFARSETYNFKEIETFSKEERRASLDLATALLKQKYANQKIEKKSYLNNFLKLLKKRSKLGKASTKEISTPISPRDGHKSAKASLSYNNKDVISGKIKMAYHDIYDNEAGYIPGSYISFFDTHIKAEKGKFSIEEMNFFDIRSYAIQDAIFKPISWQVTLGGKRIFNHEFNTYIKAGGGFTIGNEKLFAFSTITPSLYYRKEEDFSLSSNTGIIYNPSRNYKFGILATKEWFDKGSSITEIEPFSTYSFNQIYSIHLRYNYKKINKIQERNLQLSWFWYF